MEEPTPRNSRLVIAGSLAAVAVLGGGGFLLGRTTAPVAPPVAALPTPVPTASPEPAAAASTDTLDRAGIIGIGNAAADAFASGTALPAQVTDATDRRFQLLLPLGCGGPTPEGDDAATGWRYDQATSTLRVRIEPTVWSPATLWGDRVPPGIGSLQGFWIAQPWSSRETCTTAAAVTAAPGIEPVTLPGQTLGLAQLFTIDAGRRSLREGKPFALTSRVDRAALDLSLGLQLRLTGRVDRFPGGAPVRCVQPAGAEQRPICLVAVRFDEVSILNPASRAPLATWSVAQDVRSDP